MLHAGVERWRFPISPQRPSIGAEGPIENDQRAVFEAFAYRFRSAALLIQSLRNDAGSLLKGTLEATSIAAIIVDQFQRILTLTKVAENYLDETDLLQCKNGRFRPRRDIEARLSQAIAASVRRSCPPPTKQPYLVLIICSGNQESGRLVKGPLSVRRAAGKRVFNFYQKRSHFTPKWTLFQRTVVPRSAEI
jgi:hypothetical protein